MVGKILIVDDVATNRIVMKVKLAAAGYHPFVAADGAACLKMAQQEYPDLILLDLLLPDMSGADVLAQLQANPTTRGVPVVVFSASHAADARLQAFRAGADDFLPKPIDDQTLLARIRGILRSREAALGARGAGGSELALLGMAEAGAGFEAPGQIALVVAKPERGMRLRRDLMAKLAHRVILMTKDEALAHGLKAGGAFDAFVIDADLATQGDGLRLMSELNSRASTRHAGFSVLLSLANQASTAIAYDLGANDVMSEQASGEEMALRLERLIRRKRESDRARASVQDGLRLAMIDPLTGLHNRRYGLAQLGAIFDQATASGATFAVLVVDVDRFKSVNDQWGHAVGDAVLIEVAAQLRQNLREGDLLARIGGEEFLIALPDISLGEARTIADRLCAAIAENPVSLAKGQMVPVTVSIGLAISEKGKTPVHLDTVTEMFDRADRALMHSKSAGRNKVTVSRTAA